MSLLNNFYATTLSVGHQKYTALQRFPYRPNHQLAPTVYSPRNVHYHYSIGVTSYFHNLRFNGIWNRCRVTSRYNQQNRNPQEKTVEEEERRGISMEPLSLRDSSKT